MLPTKKKSGPVGTWIPESREFFSSVLNDTLKSLRENSVLGLNPTEEMALAKLDTVWMKKYKPSQRQPESTPCHKPEPKPRSPRKLPKPIPAQTQEASDEQYEDVNTFDDNEQILYRICIPPLRPHWKCRSFDIKLAAYICKGNLIAPLINWELLDSVMELPADEGTVVLQNYLDKNLLESEDEDEMSD